MPRYAVVVLSVIFGLLITWSEHPSPVPARAAFPGENGLIAYSAAGMINTVTPDGVAVTPLAQGLQPNWSADGQKIAFRRDLSGGNAEIFVMNGDGTGQTNLTNDPASDLQPAWSPDGESIAFLSNRIGSYQVWLMNADGSAPRQVTNFASGAVHGDGLSWSPDGTRILFAYSEGDESYDLFTVSPNGGSPTNITDTPAPHHEFAGVWSPDGQRIAYSGWHDGCVNCTLSLYVISAGGGARQRITNPPQQTDAVSGDRQPSWSPDGEEIAFIRHAPLPSPKELMLVDVDGASERAVGVTGDDPDWQPTICLSLFDVPEDLQTVDDLDGDGIPNEVEEQETETDPECPDTDGDGLLDPWEVPESVTGSGFDIDQDGSADVGRDVVFGPYNGECDDGFGPRREPDGQNCSLVFEPDPLHKDIYIEMDWQDCFLGSCPELVGLTLDPSHHAPAMPGLLDAVNVFRDAPVDNPDDVDGIDLHILVDEAVPHDHNCDQGAAETRPTNFGTPAQRGDPEVLAAKEMAFRYAWSGHSSLRPTPQECPLPAFWEVLAAGFGVHPLPFYDISPHGYAEPGGRDILVTLAVSWVCQLYTFDSGPFSYLPPCFRTLAPVTGIAPGLFPAEIALPGGGELDVQWPMHMMLGVSPSQGVRQLWGRAFMNLLGQSLGLSGPNAGNDPNQIAPHEPESYGSWEGLVYAPPASGTPAGRHAHPPGAGAHAHPAGSAGFVPIMPDFGLAEQDADGDGTPEGADNCPALVNASQADLDSDGYGDGCDADEDGDGLSGDDDDFPGDTDNDGTTNGADPDDDGDGVLDAPDNCPLAANTGQEDADGDGAGDACDLDADGDGLPNGLEAMAGSEVNDGSSTPEFLGRAESCSDGLDNDGDGDTDGADDGCKDADGDTVPNSLDNCPGVSSINVLDADEDGVGNICDPEFVPGDVDCDGDVDAVDAQKTLQHVAGLPVVQEPACPAIGSGGPPFGDVDCDDDVDAVDALSVLRHVAALPVNLPPGCPEIGARRRRRPSVAGAEEVRV